MGPGIGDYRELEKILPDDYTSLLSPKETQNAIYAVKDYIEENLCKELNLIRVTIPLSIGGGIGQSRTFMLLLKKAHLGEVSATVWPRVLKEMCRKKNIHVIE